MKIRITTNSIRFRLRKHEVQSLSHQQSIIETLEFGIQPNDQLQFQLSIAKDDQFAIDFNDGKVCLMIPGQLAEEWKETELVGFEENISTKNGKTIKLLVEKDFACLKDSNEENEGAYHNPQANC